MLKKLQHVFLTLLVSSHLIANLPPTDATPTLELTERQLLKNPSTTAEQIKKLEELINTCILQKKSKHSWLSMCKSIGISASIAVTLWAAADLAEIYLGGSDAQLLPITPIPQSLRENKFILQNGNTLSIIAGCIGLVALWRTALWATQENTATDPLVILTIQSLHKDLEALLYATQSVDNAALLSSVQTVINQLEDAAKVTLKQKLGSITLNSIAILSLWLLAEIHLAKEGRGSLFTNAPLLSQSMKQSIRRNTHNTYQTAAQIGIALIGSLALYQANKSTNATATIKKATTLLKNSSRAYNHK